MHTHTHTLHAQITHHRLAACVFDWSRCVCLEARQNTNNQPTDASRKVGWWFNFMQITHLMPPETYQRSPELLPSPLSQRDHFVFFRGWLVLGPPVPLVVQYGGSRRWNRRLGYVNWVKFLVCVCAPEMVSTIPLKREPIWKSLWWKSSQSRGGFAA